VADDVSDKADWALAAEAILRGTMRGAAAGAAEWPEGRLDSCEIVWSSRPKYLKREDGTVDVLSDSDEPNVGPATVTTRYVWEPPPPKLPPKT
jgi:hypothetical protein